ncbi:MAG: ABC transporter permease [Culicoidibacterales bacterium]
MKAVIKVTMELCRNLAIIHRLAINDLIVQNKGNLLGVLWLWINPSIQIMIYAVVFGQIRKNIPVQGVDFFYWVIAGFFMWNYISSVITPGSRSIVGKMGVITKMKFPISIVPAIVVVSELYIHILMVATVSVILVISGFPMNIYWLQLPYFMFAATCLLYSLSLFNSAMTTVVRDYQHIVYNVMRTMFFITPIIFPVNSMTGVMLLIIKLNPFTYLIEGYRDAFIFGRRTMLMSFRWGAYFWVIVILFYIVGSILHVRMRKNLLDYS